MAVEQKSAAQNNRLANPHACQGRAAERFKLRGRAQLLSGVDVEQAADVMLEDLSCDGAGFVSVVDLSAGKSVVLILRRPGDTSLNVQGEITGSKVIEDGQFRIGMRFTSVNARTTERIRQALFPSDGISA
jgi:hypothetical protein